MIRTLTAVSLVALTLSACGTSDERRGLTGAGIGAGVGAAGAAVTGGDPLTGALIGGAVGGATGVLTDEEDVNLDRANPFD